MERVVYWFLFGLAIATFYIGLRAKAYQVEYTLAALGFWFLAYLINMRLKRDSD